MFLSSNLNQRSIVSFLVMLVLLIAIGVGVYFVQYKTSLFSKASDSNSHISELTSELLIIKNIYVSNKTAFRNSSTDQSRAISIATQRKNLLVKESETNPALFLKEANLIAQASEFPPEVQEYLEQQVEVKGDLLVIHSDDFQGKKPKEDYWLTNPKFVKQSNPQVKLKSKNFKLSIQNRSPEISTNNVTVSAIVLGNFLTVRSGDQSAVDLNIKDLSQTQSPVRTAVGDQKTAVILLQSPGDVLPTTPSELKTILFDGPMSVNNYYKNNSYGQTSFSGDVFGWYQLGSNMQGCDSLVLADAGDTLATAAGVNLDLYPRRVYVMSTKYCFDGAYGTIGGSPSRSWIFYAHNDPRIYEHELGHNLGVHHANLITCSGFEPAVYCSGGLEYGDVYDVMGNFWNVETNSFQFNAPHKIATNWLGETKIQNINSNGIYTVPALEDSSSLAPVLKIPISPANSLYISYRQKLGFDGGLPNPVVEGVSVHSWSGLAYEQTYLLDLSGNVETATLADNEVFYDTASGIRIKQLSHTSDSSASAKVEINVGSKIYADISAVPNPCPLVAGKCVTKVNWNTVNAKNVKVVIRETGEVFANGESGSKEKELTDQGYTFDLYSDENMIATTFVFPVLPKPETPKISLKVSCISQDYAGDGVEISWSNQGSRISYVEIASDKDFSNYSTKYVESSPVLAPIGFFGGTQGLILTLSPGQTYFVRLYNGQEGDPSTFSIPGCQPLSAQYQVVPPLKWTVNQSQTYPVIVKNTGTETWNITSPKIVALGINFGGISDVAGKDWSANQAFPLPKDATTENSVTISAKVTPPTNPGYYILRHRMYKDGISWFDQMQKTYVSVLSPKKLYALYTSAPPIQWYLGQAKTYNITVVNLGQDTWNATGANQIRLGVSFGGNDDTPGVGWATDQRFNLPKDLLPGDSSTFSVVITPPKNNPGFYILRHSMLKEGVAWFESAQKTTITLSPLIR